MDNSDYSRNRNNEYLGVNRIGKNIRKSPLHQPNFPNPARQQPQPQVYNINKNDFQSIVQQLTGSPSRQSQEPVPRPPLNSPKPASMRLQRIRPSPLTPLNVTRPRMPIHHAPPQEQMPPHHGQPQPHHGQPRPPPPHGAVPFNGNLARPPQHGQSHGQPRPPPPMAAQPMSSGDHPGWSNTAESPISQYMRYLQHSIMDPTQGHPQYHPQYQQNPQSQNQSQNQIQGQQHQQQQFMPPLPSPRMNGGPPTPLPSPRMGGPPPLPSPRMGGPPPLPSPTSQFLLPSPSGYLNLLSPRSPYPLLSPGYQYPPPLTPNFSFSPMNQPSPFGNQPGPFGPGSHPPPPSPGMGFPSPGFFSIPSPRWRD